MVGLAGEDLAGSILHFEGLLEIYTGQKTICIIWCNITGVLSILLVISRLAGDYARLCRFFKFLHKMCRHEYI